MAAISGVSRLDWFTAQTIADKPMTEITMAYL